MMGWASIPQWVNTGCIWKSIICYHSQTVSVTSAYNVCAMQRQRGGRQAEVMLIPNQRFRQTSWAGWGWCLAEGAAMFTIMPFLKIFGRLSGKSSPTKTKGTDCMAVRSALGSVKSPFQSFSIFFLLFYQCFSSTEAWWDLSQWL